MSATLCLDRSATPSGRPVSIGVSTSISWGIWVLLRCARLTHDDVAL